MSKVNPEPGARYLTLPDTRLYVVERGSGYPLLILHGGPGMDHHMFADYLDPLGDQFQLILVDQRSQGRSDATDPQTWSLRQMARDVVDLAAALKLERYAVLGHSYGALVALQNAVDFPGQAAQTIISGGFPSARYLEHVVKNLEIFEPEALRASVAASWERETQVETHDDVAQLLHDQMPFHFANPLDPRIAELEARSSEAIYSPQVLRHFALQEYGGIEVEERLGQVTQPTLVLAGRHDRACSVPAAQAIHNGIPGSELVIFEHSGHMTFVEEKQLYLEAVRKFLSKHLLEEQ